VFTGFGRLGTEGLSKEHNSSIEAKALQTTETGHLGLSDEELTRVDKWATTHGVSRCQVMRALILKGLAWHQTVRALRLGNVQNLASIVGPRLPPI